MEHTCDLSNAGLITESYSNQVGDSVAPSLKKSDSAQSGNSGSWVNADTINQGIGLITSVVDASKKSDDKKYLKQMCGGKGWFLSSKAKKDKYKKCVANLKAQEEAAAAQAALGNKNTEEKPTFLYMPKPLGITVLVVGILLIGAVTTVIIIKTRKSGSVAQVAQPTV